MPPHPLTNFEIMEYYKNEPRFNGVYSRDRLPSVVKDGAYVVNLDEFEDSGTHWVAVFVERGSKATYFDSFGVTSLPEEIKGFLEGKNLVVNLYRVQAYDSIMCGYFCIGFINHILKGLGLHLPCCFHPLISGKTIK